MQHSPPSCQRFQTFDYFTFRAQRCCHKFIILHVETWAFPPRAEATIAFQSFLWSFRIFRRPGYWIHSAACSLSALLSLPPQCSVGSTSVSMLHTVTNMGLQLFVQSQIRSPLSQELRRFCVFQMIWMGNIELTFLFGCHLSVNFFFFLQCYVWRHLYLRTLFPLLDVKKELECNFVSWYFCSYLSLIDLGFQFLFVCVCIFFLLIIINVCAIITMERWKFFSFPSFSLYFV